MIYLMVLKLILDFSQYFPLFIGAVNSFLHLALKSNALISRRNSPAENEDTNP